MAYETVKRNRFYNPDSGQIVSHASRNHYEDLHDFHIPLERMHNSNLHDWGIARGLEVNGAIGGTEIIVNPGVAIDINGQLISLSDEGHADIGSNPSEGESNEVDVPVHLSTENHAGQTVCVTIQYSEILRTNEGVLGKLEQVPWVRLQQVQPPNDFDGKSIVLAITVIDSEGKLTEMRAVDGFLRRRLIGETIEELQIQRSIKEEDKVQHTLSGKIGPGEGGGLKITVPDTQDSILFARENGDEFKSLEIRAKVGIGMTNPSAELEINGNIKAGDIELENLLVQGNVGIGTTDPKEKLDVFGTIRLHGKNAFQADEHFLRINRDNEFTSGTYIMHRANFDGGVSIGKRRDVDPGEENLLVQGKVGIGGVFPSESLEVAGNIKVHPKRTFPFFFTSSIIVGHNDQINKALNFAIQDNPTIPRPPSRTINVGNEWSFNATKKNFLIDHPLYPDTHELVHSTLEGPEIAVFYRGEGQLSNGETTISLPDYFEALARKENRTVLLTPKFEEGTEISILAASEVKDGKFTVVKMAESKNSSQKFYWEVKAIRADVDILQVERVKTQLND